MLELVSVNDDDSQESRRRAEALRLQEEEVKREKEVKLLDYFCPCSGASQEDGRSETPGGREDEGTEGDGGEVPDDGG